MERKFNRVLFFYGSLRKGEYNFERFEQQWPGALEEIGTGYIVGWNLIDLGSYPSIVPADVDASVVGEVYDVSDEVFAHVEALEAEADYRRYTVDVHTTDSAPCVQAYVYGFSRPAEISDRPRIESGDWKRRLKSSAE
jgi:gamma-glutamylcyclotransferase (GGCT)/AIG2-like uncharacterized protein YtfP